MATTNKVQGWLCLLMTEDSSSHWPMKRRHVYSETSRRAGLEFVCIVGHDGLATRLCFWTWREAEVRARCQTRPAQPVCIKRGALAFDEFIEGQCASFCRFRSVNSQARTGVYFLLIKSAVH